MVTTSPAGGPKLADELRSALASENECKLDLLASMAPLDLRDRFDTLLTIYDLHLGPVEMLHESVR